MNQTQDRFLEDLQIAIPCSADWDDMTGDERTRFCQSCRLHVYDFSAMSRADAEHLVHEAEGDVCARMYRRADGTVLTSDCPVGIRALPRQVIAMFTRAAVFVGCILTGLNGDLTAQEKGKTVEVVSGEKVKPELGKIRVPQGKLMGRIRMPRVEVGKPKPADKPVKSDKPVKADKPQKAKKPKLAHKSKAAHTANKN